MILRAYLKPNKGASCFCTYTQEETLTFIPEGTELNQLIAGFRSKRMETFLQMLKETFAYPEEVLRLHLINLSNNIMTINAPVKGHNPRQLRINTITSKTFRN